jgi:anti-sigma B factor antagonist
MTTQTGDLVIEARGDTLYVRGDVDLHNAPTLRREAEEHVRASAQPRLDMTDVPFLDSAGLAVLLTLSRQAQSDGKTLRLLVTGSPRRVLKITGIDRMLMLED